MFDSLSFGDLVMSCARAIMASDHPALSEDVQGLRLLKPQGTSTLTGDLHSENRVGRDLVEGRNGAPEPVHPATVVLKLRLDGLQLPPSARGSRRRVTLAVPRS